ncbi:MAG: di-heme oxidoredictase family protein [Pseudomonadota bacterium]
MARRGITHTSVLALAVFSAGVAVTRSLAEEPSPVDQDLLNEMVAHDPGEAFIYAFDAGDELTEATFTSERGVGAYVGELLRFTRMPRPDLTGPGEWSQHLPMREGGPNATSCISCHSVPTANGAGGVALNVLVDPLHIGEPAQYLERNTLHLFALGAVQRLAEEMTSDLQGQREALETRVCESGEPDVQALIANGVAFGVIGAERVAEAPCEIAFVTTGIEGVDEDLVIRPFGWKGTHATIRAFTRGAAHNELGMQAVELIGDADGDFDGVTNELTVGDLTALAIYMAALERPTSLVELADHGIVELEDEQRSAIMRGEQAFADAGCGSCHVPSMTLRDPMFQEPSAHPNFGEAVLPNGDEAAAHGLHAARPVSFDLTADQPNNRIELADGSVVHLGAFERTENGGALIRWYSDFRRHEMGPALADPVDAFGIGASVWPTRSLAGVGSTGPWLHNGHATTLHEAIIAHGGEAAASRDAYLALSAEERANLVAFLENLVIYTDPHAEEEDDP